MLNCLGTIGEYLSWLYNGRQWATWELIALAAALLFVARLILKRLRRRPIRRTHGSHFLDGASVIGVKLSDQMRSRHGSADSKRGGSMHPVEKHEKPQKTVKMTGSWKRIVEQVRQKPNDLKLKEDLAELTAAYEAARDKKSSADAHSTEKVAQAEPEPAASEPPRKDDVEARQAQAKLEQRIAELTEANERLQRELAESRQAKEPLEQELAGQTSANEQLLKEVAEIRQAEERLEQKISELTAANEQLQQKVAQGSITPDKQTDDDRHRVVDGVSEKLCGNCGRWKPQDQYSKHASSKDGLANQCKQCRAEAARLRREKRNTPKD